MLLQIDLSDPTERITAQRFICGSNCIPAPGEPPLVLFDNADAPTRGPVVVPSFPEGDYRFVVGTVSGGCEIQVLVLEQNAGDEDVIRFQLCPAGG